MRWEYLKFVIRNGKVESAVGFNEIIAGVDESIALIKAGREGWELVSVCCVEVTKLCYLFKRQY